MRYVILAFIFCASVWADWPCREEASMSLGPSTILACGVGKADTESKARKLAYDNAMDEFKSLCTDSSGCNSKKARVTPKRMECDSEDGEVTCYRALEVTTEPKKPTVKTEDIGLRVSFGVEVGSTSYDLVKTGFSARMSYCLVSFFCPIVGVSTGKLSYQSKEVGTFSSLDAGIQSFVYENWYIHGKVGLESTTLLPTYSLGVGVDAVKVENFALTLEGSAVAVDGEVRPRAGFFGTIDF